MQAHGIVVGGMFVGGAEGAFIGTERDAQRTLVHVIKIKEFVHGMIVKRIGAVSGGRLMSGCLDSVG